MSKGMTDKEKQIVINIAEKIKALAKNQNMTQKDLAKNIGFADNAISEWSIARVKPGFDDVIDMSDYFNVSTDYLLGLAEDKVQQNSSAVTVVQIPDEVSGLISDYQKLDWDGQKAVIRTIDKELERIKSGNAESGAS